MEGNAQVGVIGLGVMGENLAINMERHGYVVAVFNRHVDKVEEFVNGIGKGKKIIGCKDEAALVRCLERPRKIVLLVKAGEPVDSTIAKLEPYLEEGDIIVDGGNSYFMDTRRRESLLSSRGLSFIGSGVSGGEEGALWGPSLMPGGCRQAYEQIRPIWEAIAAKVDDGACVAYLGPDGAGHFVKMVHNGIEYGDMQLIAEAYDLLRRACRLSSEEIGSIFDKWNHGKLNSFLIEITAAILTVCDPQSGKPLIDLIADKAGQKGTGKWTIQSATELGVPTPTIDAALSARMISNLKDERIEAAKLLAGPGQMNKSTNGSELIGALEDALYASKICSYAQGMALLAAGSREYSWNMNLAEVARIWKGGCIIRAQVLDAISQAFRRKPELPNLLIDDQLSAQVVKGQSRWRQVIMTANKLGIPVPALSASLAYFDSYRCSQLPQNLTQAQRDYFGSHTYERIDKPELGFIHTDWDNLIKVRMASGAKISQTLEH